MTKLKLLALIVTGNALLASSRVPGYTWAISGRQDRQEVMESTLKPTTTTGTTTTDSQWILEEFPWVVGLAADAEHFVCTGVLIHRQWVLTTALCVNRHASQAVYGIKNKYKSDIAHTVRHPYFRYETNKTHIVSMYNDIGMIYLKSNLNYSLYMNQTAGVNKKATDRPIPMAKDHLPFGDIDYRDQVVNVYGYGMNAGFKKSLPKKSQLYLKVCQPAKWAYAHCACNVNELRNVSYCGADSGAPVLVNGLLVGLATLAPEKCRWTNIMTFNSVYEHLPWIFYTAKLFKELYDESASNSPARTEPSYYLTTALSIATALLVG